MQYNITPNNIHIYNSWIYSKHGFRTRLEGLKQDHEADCLVLQNRSIWSMEMEWATHNFCYDRGWWLDRVTDTDLNWPQKWYIRLVYVIVGPVAWLFIK